MGDAKPSDGSADQSFDKLLLADLEVFHGSFWKNEELGEKRVSFLITLVTAVITALVALAKTSSDDGSDALKGLGTSVSEIGIIATATLLAIGIMTFLRMVRRNCVSEEYKKAADYVRGLLSTAESCPYQPIGRKGVDIPFKSAGLANLVAVINGIVAAFLIFLLISNFGPTTTSPRFLAVGFALAGAVLLILLQMACASVTRKKVKNALEDAYPTREC